MIRVSSDGMYIQGVSLSWYSMHIFEEFYVMAEENAYAIYGHAMGEQLTVLIADGLFNRELAQKVLDDFMEGR